MILALAINAYYEYLPQLPNTTTYYKHLLQIPMTNTLNTGTTPPCV